MSTPVRAPLDQPRLRELLTRAGYAHVDVVETTGSTNTDLADRVRVGEDLPDMTVLLAEEQSAGRGRKGRSFGAPARSQIICSVLLRLTDVPADRIGLLPLLTGLSIAEGLPIAAQLKWPNDVIMGGRKLAGILVEAVHLQPHPAVIIGFGINYDLQPGEIDVPHASSIAAEAGAQDVPDRTLVTADVLAQLAVNLQRWRGLGGAPQTVLPRYRSICATLGTQVRAHLPGEKVLTGQAVDVDNEGELLVRGSDGTRHTVRAGEIVHLRPDGSGDYGPGVGA
ncbi:MAG TPA: biotin--[acetyl-CoA-carboxylase] ligase [Candidatus Corynebacterium gallistercoris]|uniref:biotin--[biotin carboxyl-carrier protein] ligase n=1 Tax=Candidatus Corynebacterium gallistercoris TaxID=2838530 RepID=A0A9D1S0M8_9CORY|nr:biotin--[acetyl-CoA-carboxylase] ligase [Candidatus Corynebacterium gallistercoris]